MVRDFFSIDHTSIGLEDRQLLHGPRAERIDSGLALLGGHLKRVDTVDGFENLPAALIGLLAGENIGKRMVRVA
jgi:hypothetical protein